MSTHCNKTTTLLRTIKEAQVFVEMLERTHTHKHPLIFTHQRFMTTSKRVKDRSRKKRIHELESAKENWKTLSKTVSIIEILKKEPDTIIPLRDLERHREKLSLQKPNRVIDFLRKSPELFELYKDSRGVWWCGMTNGCEDLLQEEERLLEEQGTKTAEFVTRCLMMSVDNRLAIDKIAHFRRDFGLPLNFRTTWVHNYPELFRVVKCKGDTDGINNSAKGVEYLELVNWNPAWAVTELEKKVLGINAVDGGSGEPGILSLAFPLKFPPRYKSISRYKEKIKIFQKTCYLSPYADAKGLVPGSMEFDKRAVAIMHELLSFTMEKRLVTDHLTHFRREFVMPQKLMRLLLKHIGIFYVSERGKRYSVFLKEAYEGGELIEKCPLVLWRERVMTMIGYRKKKKIETMSDLSDLEDSCFVDNGSEGEVISLESDAEEEPMRYVKDDDLNDEEMEIGELVVE